MEVTEKQGAIARDAGSCIFVTDLEAHRTDWKRAVRIILNAVSSCRIKAFLMTMLKRSDFFRINTLATF